MEKNKFNTKFRDYARTLSPKTDERVMLSKIYQSFNELLGINNCIQIGSYPRFTAITPIHDLDILYFLGNWNENKHDPTAVLQNLNTQINNDYKNPTDYKIEVTIQTHSVTISYLKSSEEIFSVDIVPAYFYSKNEFAEDTYKVPEVIRKKHGKSRVEYYQKLSQERKEMGWITSDPRGYIKIASDINKSTNGEFRKTVKMIKVWKNNLTNEDPSLKLKSFHLEQIITKYFIDNNNIEIFDVVFKFFVELSEIINKPNQIKDRANDDKFIDNYLEDFTNFQKEKIKQARDCFLVKLESFLETDLAMDLFNVCFYKRNSETEQFLYDYNLPILTESNRFRIDGFIQKKDGFRDGWLSEVDNKIAKGRKIKFSIRNDVEKNYSMWKVQNDKKSDEVLNASAIRGEITKNSTRNNPESTAYKGRHYVEGYAIRDNACVARSRIDVVIN
ncbi:MAG: nucleotide-binding domain-containing protein [Candidatus Humimicrobiaceae bacterium]